MKTDVVIVGGGPAGTATALFLEQHGIQSTIVEKEHFPRFHIGESLTGEGSRALRDLGLEDQMIAAGCPIKYATIVHGDKRDHFEIRVMARSPENKLQDSSTWQVRRSTFDKMLLETAVERGSKLVNGKAIKTLYGENNDIKGIQVRTTDSCLQEIPAKVVVDASGSATFLAKSGCTSKK